MPNVTHNVKRCGMQEVRVPTFFELQYVKQNF